MNKETRKELEQEVMRLIPRAIYTMKNTYRDENGYLALQDFFTAVPFAVKINLIDEDKYKSLQNSVVHPEIFKYIGGYTKLVKNDEDINYLKVYIVVNAPSSLDSPEEAIEWVNDNIILNGGHSNYGKLNGGTALMFVYMHEISHIMHKHLMPSINTKFDALIDKLWNKQSKIPGNLKHKIKNFAEDFFINSLLLETAHNESDLYKLSEDVRNGEKFAFLYNPELSASKNHSVETIIKELVENLEAEKINFCGSQGNTQGNGQGNGQGNQQDGDQETDQQNGGQGNQQDGDQEITETRYKLKYGDFEYEFWDLHDESNCQNGQSANGEEGNEQAIADAVRDASNQVTNKLRGSGTAGIADALGFPIEVTVDWLGILESDLFKEVRHKTNKVSSTWRRLKNKYRHIAYLPATVNYENVLNAVVVIDQSGSMSNLELRKINYIIKKLVKRVKTLRVIIHDDGVVYNKEFKRIIERNLEKELFKKRVACGGTSHDEVFEIIENECYKKYKNEDFIVLIFSDMYSNIEMLWNKFSWTETTNTYLVCTEKEGARRVENVPATKILMDTGEKL